MSHAETRPLEDLLTLHELLPPAWHAGLRAGAFLRDERPADLVIDVSAAGRPPRRGASSNSRTGPSSAPAAKARAP